MEPQLLVSSLAAQISRLDPAGAMPLSRGWWVPKHLECLLPTPGGPAYSRLTVSHGGSQEGAAVTEGLRSIKLIQLGRLGEASLPSIHGLLPATGGLGAMPPFPHSVTLGPGPGGLALDMSGWLSQP